VTSPSQKEPPSEEAIKKLAEAEMQAEASATANAMRRYERIQMTVRIIFAVLCVALLAMMFYAFTLLMQLSQKRPSSRGPTTPGPVPSQQ
jgi:type VI protein secretion system component VasF